MTTTVPFSLPYASGVRDLILPIQQIEFGVPVSLADQPDLMDIPGFYQKGAGNFWIALDQDQVVGTIGLLDIGQRQGAVRKMFVAATHRGSRQGVASQLLATLLMWSAAHHFEAIFLGTTEKFLAAHRFYEKNGFTLVERQTLPGAFPVMAVDTRFYTRTIAAT